MHLPVVELPAVELLTFAADDSDVELVLAVVEDCAQLVAVGPGDAVEG